METYRFKETVRTDGTVILSGLPPKKKVEIVVSEKAACSEETRKWLKDIRSRHKFANMSKAEILEKLRKTRDIVWAERHEN